jgi:tight adherence protein B
MSEAGNIMLLATALAAVSAAALICGLFYPLVARPRLADQRSAVFQALLSGHAGGALAATRTVRRAQEIALKSVAQQGRPSRSSQLERQLAAAGLGWTPQRYIALCLAFAGMIFIAALILRFAALPALMTALIAALVAPQRYLAFRADRRRKAFLAAFGNAVDMIVRGAKSGLSLMDCLAIVASDAEEPVKLEFESILAQLRAGVPLSAAMDKLAAAMPLAEVRFFVLLMSMQSQTGGNLTEALINLSKILRARDQIASKVRIASAEVRASALIIGALPFLVIGATAAFAPDYIRILWTDDAGRRITIFAAVWMLAGFLVLRRMARIEV